MKHKHENVELIPGTSYKLYSNVKDAFDIIDQKVTAYDTKCVPPTQNPEMIYLYYLIKENDKIIAGICADVYIWKILCIDLMFVHEDYRHKKLGSFLIKKVEKEARALGAKLSHTDSWDFQAKDFYIKHGYEVFGVLEDCPPGHKRFYLKKNLNSNNDVTILDTSKQNIPQLENIHENVELIPGTAYKVYNDVENAFDIIDQKLFEYNKKCVPATQNPEVIDLYYVVKDNNEIIAGICADVYIWKILHIDLIFVHEDYRHKKLGSFLIKKVEQEAKSLGAKLAHLNSFDFQAKDFYIKHGYEVFGVLDGSPPGHKRFYLKKNL